MIFKSIFDQQNSTPFDNGKYEKTKRALIIHPGAMGDCILTLHLCKFLKDYLKIDQLVFMGCSDYISFLPGRSCVDKIRSINSIELNRLFSDPKSFHLEENDKLTLDLAGYEWVINFIGDKGSDFEQNLIYAIYCTSSTDVATLSARAPEEYKYHMSQFHIDEFIHEKKYSVTAFTEPQEWNFDFEQKTISFLQSDKINGTNLMREIHPCFDSLKPTAVVAPGSGSKEKCWHITNFAKLAEKLCNSDINCVFSLGPVEIERFSENDINLLTKYGAVIKNLDIVKTGQLIASADFFIGNDSGPSHLSGAAGIKTFTIFGKTDHNRYRPVGPHITVLNEPVDSFKSFNEKSVENVYARIIGQ